MILAVDTSSVQGSIALISKDYKLVAENSWKKSKDKKSSGKHSEIILIKLKNLLAENKVELKDLTEICVGVGPGRFTGIRVGLCLVNSLAYSLGIPIRATESLNLLIAPLLEKNKNCIALVNAHKNQFFFKEVKNQVVGDSCALPVLELEKTIETEVICVGDGFDEYQDQLSENLKLRLLRDTEYSDYPEAKHFVYLLGNHVKLLNNSDWKSNKALYIRASEAEEKLWKGMLKLPEKII